MKKITSMCVSGFLVSFVSGSFETYKRIRALWLVISVELDVGGSLKTQRRKKTQEMSAEGGLDLKLHKIKLLSSFNPVEGLVL